MNTETVEPPAVVQRPDMALWAPAPIELQQFLLMEADLLDQRRLPEWLSLYTLDAVYWVPAEHGDVDPERRISLFYDDRSILEDRVWRLGHPKMFSQKPPVRQARVLSIPTVLEGSPNADRVVTSTKFILFENRLREQRTFGGTYEHHLVRQEGQWMVQRKVVRMPNCDSLLWNIGVPI